MAAPVAGSRYLTLDHWRGFASLWVLVFHANRGHPDLAPGWLGTFVTSGWLGVQVFFVISGYCIAERVAREQQRSGSVVRFTLDRLLRIYPPYWIAVGLNLVLNVAAALAKGTALGAPFVLPDGYADGLMALAAVEPWFGRATYLLVAWTISYEIGFYLCAAAGLLLVLQLRRTWAGILWWGLLLAIGLTPALNRSLPLLTLWPHFALGGLVWLVWHHAGPVWRRLALGSAAIALLWLSAAGQSAEVGFTLRVGCACAWLLLVLRPWDEALARSPLLRWLGWVGTFSYSLYLVHAPIVGKFGNLIERWPPLAARPAFMVLLSCTLTIPCAWLFYRMVELPCERFRKQLGRAPGIKPAAAPLPATTTSS